MTAGLLVRALLRKNFTNGSSRWTEGGKLNVRTCERPKVKVNEPGDFLRSVGVFVLQLKLRVVFNLMDFSKLK